MSGKRSLERQAYNVLRTQETISNAIWGVYGDTRIDKLIARNTKTKFGRSFKNGRGGLSDILHRLRLQIGQKQTLIRIFFFICFGIIEISRPLRI